MSLTPTRNVTVSRNVIFSDKVRIINNPNHAGQQLELLFKEHGTKPGERKEDTLIEEAELQNQVVQRAAPD